MQQSPLVSPHGLIPRKGYLLVVIAALMWAVSGTSGKYLINSGVTPHHLVQMRVTLATLLLLPFFLATRPHLLKISTRDIPYFALLGISGMAVVQITYFYSISKINVAVAILLQYLAPIFIALWYIFLCPEKPGRTTLLAIGISFAGCYLAVGAYNFDLLAMNWQGIVVGVLSGLSYAWYAILSERGMRRYDPWTVAVYAILFAALFWNVVLSPMEAFSIRRTPVEWFWIFYIVIFGTAVPYGLYADGISLIRSTRASVTATLEPIAAAFIAFFFLGESLGIPQILGGGLVILAVILLQLRPECDDTTAAILRARAEDPAAPNRMG